MNILVTGGNGFLGQHLTKYLSNLEHSVIATSRGERRIPAEIPVTYYSLDLTDEAAVTRLVAETKPHVIVHTAAISKPDECEKHKDSCLQNNVEATRYLLQSFKSIQQQGGLFIYLSTDFIFGEDGPHAEDDDTGPLNFYGE